MWFGLAKMALQTGAKVYSNKQKQKEAMSVAALLTAEKMARGETSYQGKLLEARQNDYKDEFVLVILSAPIIVLASFVLSAPKSPNTLAVIPTDVAVMAAPTNRATSN